MKVVSLNEFLKEKDFYVSEAKAGKIFIYPTDTVYGIWGINTPEIVDKIFLSIKWKVNDWLFSVIVPDFERIQRNYPQADIDTLKWYLEKYHGVTYILDHIRPKIRIIKHPIQDFVAALGEPFITTSCNRTWEPIIVDIKNIPEDMASKVEYIIDGGIGWGKPSVLIDFVENKIIHRDT